LLVSPSLPLCEIHTLRIPSIVPPYCCTYRFDFSLLFFFIPFLGPAHSYPRHSPSGTFYSLSSVSFSRTSFSAHHPPPIEYPCHPQLIISILLHHDRHYLSWELYDNFSHSPLFVPSSRFDSLRVQYTLTVFNRPPLSCLSSLIPPIVACLSP